MKLIEITKIRIKIGMILKQDLGILLSNLEKMSICEYQEFNIEEAEVFC